MQNMTVFYQPFSMSRLSETLDRRVFHDPTLRNLTVPCMGFLRDVAVSRQSKLACFALNCSNVIKIQHLRCC